MATTVIKVEDIGYVETLPIDSETHLPAIQQEALDQYNILVTSTIPGASDPVNGKSIAEILNKNPSTLTSEDAKNLLSDLAGLLNLAKGKNPQDGTDPAVPYILTEQMARSIDYLAKSFKAVGLDSDHATAEAVKQWQNLRSFGLDQIVTDAVAAGSANVVTIDTDPVAPVWISDDHTEQAMLELSYVKYANDYIGSQMSELNTALKLTKEAVVAMTTVQDIHNLLNTDVVGKLAALFTDRPKDENGDYISHEGETSSLTNAGNWFIILTNFSGITSLSKFTSNYLDVTSVDGSSPLGQLYDAVEEKFAGHDPDDAVHISGNGESLTVSKNEVLRSIEKVVEALSGTFDDPEGFTHNDYDTLVLFGRSLDISSSLFNSPTGSIPASVFNSPVSFVDNNGLDFVGAGEDQLRFLGFKNPISPIVNIKDEDYQTWISQLSNAKSSLQALITAMGPGTTSDALQEVLDDLPVFTGTLETDKEKINTWIMDNLDQHSTTVATGSGNFQTHITEAIGACESLNDAQQEDVRRIMYIFQQFYESAGSALLTISQLIEKMAGHIYK